MRKLSILVGLSACTTQQAAPLELEHVSVLGVQTRGMALSGSGDLGHAGMYGVTCDFTTKNALVGADYDFQGDQETVVDGTEFGDHGFTSVTISEDHAHVTFLDRGIQLSSEGTRIPGIAHARLVGDLVAVTRQTKTECQGGFVDPRAEDMQEAIVVEGLPEGACDLDASVAVDRDARTLYIATEDGLVAVSPEGWSLVEVVADLVSWDASASALYAAERGSSEIGAYEVDGTLRWSAPVEGKVRDLHHMGDNASAAVMIAREGGGAIGVFGGEDGALRSDLSTPSAAGNLVMSESGRMMGVRLPGETHFYQVHLDP